MFRQRDFSVQQLHEILNLIRVIYDHFEGGVFTEKQLIDLDEGNKGLVKVLSEIGVIRSSVNVDQDRGIEWLVDPHELSVDFFDGKDSVALFDRLTKEDRAASEDIIFSITEGEPFVVSAKTAKKLDFQLPKFLEMVFTLEREGQLTIISDPKGQKAPVAYWPDNEIPSR